MVWPKCLTRLYTNLICFLLVFGSMRLAFSSCFFATILFSMGCEHNIVSLLFDLVAELSFFHFLLIAVSECVPATILFEQIGTRKMLSNEIEIIGQAVCDCKRKFLLVVPSFTCFFAHLINSGYFVNCCFEFSDGWLPASSVAANLPYDNLGE